jgi:hypothetical protein
MTVLYEGSRWVGLTGYALHAPTYPYVLNLGSRSAIH